MGPAGATSQVLLVRRGRRHRRVGLGRRRRWPGRCWSDRAASRAC